MPKLRKPREAQGMLIREDGVRVEVKQPTVWKHIVTQEREKQTLAGVAEHLRSKHEKAEARLAALEATWWVRLGLRLRLLRVGSGETKTVDALDVPASAT